MVGSSSIKACRRRLERMMWRDIVSEHSWRMGLLAPRRLCLSLNGIVSMFLTVSTVNCVFTVRWPGCWSNHSYLVLFEREVGLSSGRFCGRY
jgi:hypothetical protein